jgi:hypothetical protein
MSVEIEKVSVFDDRIIQPQPTYAVEKGALALTNVTFSAITNTTTQLTFNVIVPSENVFVDRAVDVAATIFGQLTVSTNQASSAAGIPVFTPGSIAPAPFPLQQMATSVQATINDATVVINTVDVLPQVLRFVDYKAHRLQRTCQTALDNYQSYSSTVSGVNVATNSPLGAYNNARNADELGNGSLPNFFWCTSTSTAAGTFSTTAISADVTSTVQGQASFINGWPVGTTVTAAQTYYLNFGIRTVEKLVLSPFIFGDAYEYDTGLFGVQNIQLVMNLNPNSSRILRHAFDPLSSATLSYPSSALSAVTVSSFGNPRLLVQFLTPSLDVSLPAKSVIPYIEFPRYITTLSSGPAALSTSNQRWNNWNNPQSTRVETNTITLPMIPDLLMVYVRPTNYSSTAEANWTLPIDTISVNLDNFAGLLSSHTREQLYKMSVANGLEMDYANWSGLAETGLFAPPASALVSGTTATTTRNVWVPTVGPILLLKPGRDIPLSAGMAPGLVGNFSLQMSLNVFNNTYTDYSSGGLQIYVVTVNSGFFETIKGSSRLIKGLLTEQDIISSPEADAMTSGQVSRLVGSGIKVQNVLSKLKRRLSKMREKPAAPMGSGRGKKQPMEHMEGGGAGMRQYYQ